MNVLRGSVIGLAGVVGAGLLAWPIAGAFADGDEVRQREEQDTELVVVDDQDDDDTNDPRVTNTRADNTRDHDTHGDNTRDNTRNDHTQGDR